MNFFKIEFRPARKSNQENCVTVMQKSIFIVTGQSIYCRNKASFNEFEFIIHIIIPLLLSIIIFIHIYLTIGYVISSI